MSAAPMAFAVADRRAVRTTLLQLLRPHRTLALLAAVLFAGTAAAGLLTPLLLGVIVDRVLTGEPPGAVTALAVAIAVAGVVQAVLATAAPAAAAHATEPALAELREAVVTRSLQLPIEVVERIGTGDLVARTDGDVEAVTEAVDRVLPEMLLAGLTVVVSVIGITALDWRLGLAALTAVPLQAHTLRWYLPRSSPLYTAERVAAGERAAQLLETVSGRDTVRALGMAEHHHELVRHRSRTAADLVVAATRLRTRFFARLNLAEVVGLASILATGFVLVDRGQVSVGAVTAAALLFQRLFDPINVLLFLVDDAQSAGAALARLVGVTELPPTPTPTQASDADAKVSVLDVSHAYRTGHDVLHSIDLHVVAGETVAIVGTTGAGKSTLAALVAGLRSPDRGEVRVADLPVADLTAVGGRPPVALITQEIHVFAGSLADDLRLVAPDADDDALRTALDRVGAASWVDALPDGMDTVVGEGGHQLTATQAQHLALVRLHLVDPAVGVLDEATAETGSAGARVLEQASAAALAGRTAVVVAHRLSQAARADRIVVLDHGKIAEAGTHDELLRAGGTYAALWAAWSSSGRTDAAQRTSG